MNKKMLIVGIVIFLSVTGLSGCTNTENYEEKILGKWSVGATPEEEDVSITFDFFSNGSFCLNHTEVDEYENSTSQTVWMTYEITADNFVMIVLDDNVILDYSFSDNDKTLTLTEKDGTSTVLTRL